MSSYKKLEYTKDKNTRQKYWDIAIGLQEVDNLKPSDYLKELANDHINGNISNSEIEDKLYTIYKSDKNQWNHNRDAECDIVANRIVELLDSNIVSFNYTDLKVIHKYLFNDIYEFAGKFRDYNISKDEPILNNETVKYINYFSIEDTLEYDFKEEKKQRYSNMPIEQIIKRISEFTSSIWQVHPFGEGNTRTTAVFIEGYLNSVGFNVNNDMFKDNSKYFRNALVRANYADYNRGIDAENIYLEKFFSNLIGNTNYDLNNRDLYLNDCFDLLIEDHVEQELIQINQIDLDDMEI